MVDENEKKTKRDVPVRRGNQVTTADQDTLLPLISSHTERSSAPPPRSGNARFPPSRSGSGLLQYPPPRSSASNSAASAISIIPSMLKFNVRDKKDATAKRRFQVAIPTRMLNYVVLVFFVLPLFLFIYKEMHLGNEEHAHFKAEHYIHVDTQDVLSHLLDKPVNRTAAAASSISFGTKEASKTESSLTALSPQSQGLVAAAGDIDDLATTIGEAEARKEEPKVFNQNQNTTTTTPDAASVSSPKQQDPPEKEAEVPDASKEEPEHQQRKRRLQRQLSNHTAAVF
jgi:hypothetical protein